MNELEIQEWRLMRLQQAIEKIAEGNQTEFARRLGYKDGAFIRQILTGTRPVSEKTVAKIQALTGMKDWFSTIPEKISTANARTSIAKGAEDADLSPGAMSLIDEVKKADRRGMSPAVFQAVTALMRVIDDIQDIRYLKKD